MVLHLIHFIIRDYQILFNQPEFNEVNLVRSIGYVVDHLDEVAQNIFNEIDDIEIKIGDDNPFGRECSVLLTKFPYNQTEGLFGILGPARMDYQKSFSLLSYLNQLTLKYMNKQNKKNKEELVEEKLDNEKETTDLEEKNIEYLAGWQRAKADYINLKKETDGIIGNLRQSVKTEVFVEFLNIWQNILTAIEHIPEKDKQTDWAQGFMHSRSQVRNWLKENGIVQMKTIGQKFDYQKYDAVDTVLDKTKPPEVIVSERAPGYERNGEVIIHPKVVVNTEPEEQIEDLE